MSVLSYFPPNYLAFVFRNSPLNSEWESRTLIPCFIMKLKNQIWRNTVFICKVSFSANTCHYIVKKELFIKWTPLDVVWPLSFQVVLHLKFIRCNVTYRCNYKILNRLFSSRRQNSLFLITGQNPLLL